MLLAKGISREVESVDKTVIRTRKPWNLGTWAWLGNRIAGTALIFYLMVHIIVVSTSQAGEKNFNGLMEKAHQPIPLALEILLLLAVVFHSANGIRHILIDFGICRPKAHIALIWAVVIVCLVVFSVSVSIFGPIIMRG